MVELMWFESLPGHCQGCEVSANDKEMEVRAPTDGKWTSMKSHWIAKELCGSACMESAWFVAAWNRVALEGNQCRGELADWNRSPYIMEYNITELNGVGGMAMMNMPYIRDFVYVWRSSTRSWNAS